MNKKFAFIILLVLIFLNSGNLLFSQSPVGVWTDSQYNVKLVLYENYSYLIEHPNGKSSGRWQNTGDQFCLYDSTGLAPVCYTVISYTADKLIMRDINGFILNYKRVVNKKEANKVLAKKGNVYLFQSHMQSGVDLVQFIIGGRIKASEILELKSKLIEEFKVSPAYIVKELKSIGESMKKVKNSTNAIKIGSARQALFTTLYKSTYNLKEVQKPLIIQIINRYIKVYAIDNQNNLILTNRDIDGYINYIIFNSQLSGSNIRVNNNVINSTRKELINGFNKMNMEQKKILASASLLWELTEGNWKRLNQAQRQQYMIAYQSKVSSNFKYKQNNSTNSKNWGSNSAYNSQNNTKSKKSISQMQSEFNAKQNMFRMMQNMNTNSHALSLNIIENMGGTGDYWKVVDY